MNRKIPILLLLLTVVALYGVPSASAYGGYLNAFNQQYNTTGTQLDSCIICHAGQGGGGAVNPYGKAFKDAGNSFAAIESLDSDGDGFTNIAEINARTFPGDQNDHPVTGVNQTPASITRTPTLNDSTSENESEELVDDIEPYEGSIGPGNALYGLKIAFENIDETFTFNESEKLGKQLAHARQRIAEAKAELSKKNNEAALKALEQYREKTDLEEDSILRFSENDSGLLNAQKMIVKHQYVLERLLESHPNNTGLERAYNNSRELEDRFESRTELKLERVRGKHGREVLKEVKLAREETKVVAEIIGNGTEIKVEVKFRSNSTDNFTIAQDILDKMKSSTENIASIIELKVEDDGEKELKTKLEAEADIKKGFTKVEAEYSFPLKTTNMSDIIEGVNLRLSSLTREDILRVLEIKGKEERKDEKEEKKEQKREEKEERKDKKEEVKEQKRTDKEEIKENRSEEKEGRKDKKEETKEQKREEKEERKDKINNSEED